MDPSNILPPKFAAASESKADYIDLNDIFADQFFPADLDFSSFYNVETGSFDGNSYNEDMDYLLSMDNITADTSTTAAENPPGGVQIRAPPAGVQSDISRLSSEPVIMIPPLLPTRVATNSAVKVKSESNTQTKDTTKNAVTMSKFLKSSKPVFNGFNRPSTMPTLSDDDSDSDSERGAKRLKYDPNDPLRNERRERNREHAKKSRIRKKLMLDTLQDQLLGLRSINVQLRSIITEKLPPAAASKIFNECTTSESALLTDSISTIALSHDSNVFMNPKGQFVSTKTPMQSVKFLMEPDFRLIQALLHSQQNFVLSDPSLPDNPIVYCSDGFCKLSGYKRQEILGRNCRFLQGPGTDQNAVDLIRKGVDEGRDISVCLLNYKSDGTPFWNQFFVAALRDAEGNVINFVGVQCEVNSLPVSEIRDRVKKLPIPRGYS